MSDELHISFTIPSEYTTTGKDGMVLSMPISYARKLGKFIVEGCDHAAAKATIEASENPEALAYALMMGANG